MGKYAQPRYCGCDFSADHSTQWDRHKCDRKDLSIDRTSS